MTKPGRTSATGVSGMIHIDEELCKGCRICTVFCPTEVLQESQAINRLGYYVPLVKREEACHGCRLCELLCPEFAIFIKHE
jgi:2-oxoglutarate ferredoxin oxidoreductase subunit delta